MSSYQQENGGGPETCPHCDEEYEGHLPDHFTECKALDDLREVSPSP